MEKSHELPPANVAKIQSLYKRILSAAENPTIVDWVKTSEYKMNNMERELMNMNRALVVSQQSCEEYRKQVRKMALEWNPFIHVHWFYWRSDDGVRKENSRIVVKSQ